ncbi:g5407 [Coccomyxa viridis]|uniref:G5407 protein n=1 Tax=Coccomyxa viridis TaxID=1274662 RepID=A0ABP1FVA2_9CHLO
MDLLGGYGSDADSDVGDEAVAAPPPAGELASTKAAGDASVGNGALLSKLPAPRKKKRPVLLTVLAESIPDSDSDEEEKKRKKKRKLDTRGKSLNEVLPAPKNQSSTMGLLGGGTGSRLMGTAQDNDEDFKWRPPTGDGVLGKKDEYQADDNEVFRVEDEVPLASAAYSAAAGGPGATNGGHAPAHYSSAPGGVAGAAQQSARPPAGADAIFAGLNVELKEVKQEDLTRMDIRKREAMNATRTAFGADYEANLRMEAGPNPEKLARRKHQISSLYHQAKMKELELLESKSQGIKTKAETQAKYGW